ncbi:MAG: deoxyhypusine synthase family protein, partial [Thermoplasmatales archaeon]|nr:deoxyhypusine synthase family protein [Thermoplasmatales archaeon]
MKYNKKELLKQKIKHIDIKKLDITQLIESFDDMAFQSRNLARACKIYNDMLKDKDCTVILCLAGSLVSAGLKKIIIDLIENNMV